MELLQFARILLRRWWLVAIPTIIAAAVALPALLQRAPAAGGFTSQITYSAAQSMTAIPRTDGDYQDIWLSSELTVNAFTSWVRGGRFKQEIVTLVSDQGITVDPAQIGIAADNERSVGQIFLSYPDADGLQAITSAATTILQTRSMDYFAQLGGVPAAITILDLAPVSAAPPPIADRLGPIIRVALGLLAGIGLALLAHYVDPALRRREDLDSLGIPVLTSIPKR